MTKNWSRLLEFKENIFIRQFHKILRINISKNKVVIQFGSLKYATFIKLAFMACSIKKILMNYKKRISLSMKISINGQLAFKVHKIGY